MRNEPHVCRPFRSICSLFDSFDMASCIARLGAAQVVASAVRRDALPTTGRARAAKSDCAEAQVGRALERMGSVACARADQVAAFSFNKSASAIDTFVIVDLSVR
jgi:hypothetical protein